MEYKTLKIYKIELHRNYELVMADNMYNAIDKFINHHKNEWDFSKDNINSVTVYFDEQVLV